MQLSLENGRWLEEFRTRHGRSPRVLHIGNIANNAYNNAKLLNEAGLDCDVICYDYYHIMGCPEWEEADFSGDYGDQFKPDWVKAGVTGFERPRWFAQGPVKDCIDYLVAKREGRAKAADDLWHKLAVLNGTLTLEKSSDTQPIERQVRFADIFSWVKSAIVYLSSSREVATGIAKSCEIGLVSKVFKSESLRLIVASALILFAILLRPFGFLYRTIANLLSVAIHSNNLISRIALVCDRGLVSNIFKSEILRLFVALFLALFSIAMRPISLLFCKQQAVQEKSGSCHLDQNAIIEEFEKQFADRVGTICSDDIAQYMAYRPLWNVVFRYYDYVVGYSTDPIIPFICGCPYFAFEHGTIREIPYQNSGQGRMTALAYRLAQHVFVTNFDCVESAAYLAPGRFTIINHPYDEDHGLSISGSELLRNELLSELDCDFIFFHPARHDWVEGTGYADKGNDVFLKAFASLRAKGLRVGLVLCNWGENVSESKALLKHLACAANAKWVAPMAITPFERMCRAADIVVDQFKLGAFGGVVFKAMAVGTPILSYLDESRLLKQYDECPPVVNCRTSEEIIAKMSVLIPSPNEIRKAGEASRAWMKNHHAKGMVVNAQVNQFRQCAPISVALDRVSTSTL